MTADPWRPSHCYSLRSPWLLSEHVGYFAKYQSVNRHKELPVKWQRDTCTDHVNKFQALKAKPDICKVILFQIKTVIINNLAIFTTKILKTMV